VVVRSRWPVAAERVWTAVVTSWTAGDVDYERRGGSYVRHRRADPRIAALVHRALGKAHTVVNVGAGAGSYEPEDRTVVPVEPSPTMRAQRPGHLPAALAGVAEALPFPDGSFDAATAVVTLHQWSDPARGLAELRRVARGPVVILTFDGDALDRFWLARYVPELVRAERRRFPSLAQIAAALGGKVTVDEVPVPRDCTDGFTEAFYARPEAFLDDEVRRAQSAWAFVDAAVEARFVQRLAADLDTGEWARRFGHHLSMPTFTGALRLLTADGRAS
jgi:SAM-dependent methyltransferase